MQIDRFQDGLLKRVVGRDGNGRLVRKAGIMSIVREGGVVRPGDPVTVDECPRAAPPPGPGVTPGPPRRAA
ncbi:hypothetical protein SFUMM280S_04374 [Streptomyces fumanus]